MEQTNKRTGLSVSGKEYEEASQIERKIEPILMWFESISWRRRDIKMEDVSKGVEPQRFHLLKIRGRGNIVGACQMVMWDSYPLKPSCPSTLPTGPQYGITS